MERDFTFIDDIIAGVVSVIDEPAIADPTWDGQSPNPSTSTAPYRIYNIGNNKPVRLLDFIELIEKSAKRKAKKNFLPMQSGDVQATFANIDELNKLSGFVPKTELDEGIDKFVTWYKQYYSL
jgi:UDP-glucuronate 4-epimerase